MTPADLQPTMGWDMMRSNEKNTKSSNAFVVFFAQCGVETMHGFFWGEKMRELAKELKFHQKRNHKHSCQTFRAGSPETCFLLERKRRNIEPFWLPNLNVSETWTFQFGCQMLGLEEKGVNSIHHPLGFFFGTSKGRKVRGGCTSKLTHQIWSLNPWRVPFIGDS